ncbi:MAG TPA: acyltransferase [Candidatus Eisenbacteria bacterium]|nr:acyltransferase [Candidatus Eisenbacteria bacterium]
MGRTLATAYDRGRNNFDALRFALATLVLWSHAYSLDAELDPLLAFSGRQMSGGAVGVEGFFIVSGFLVTQSWLGTAGLARFAEKRARRVLPGLLVAMAVGVFAIGPFVTTQPLGTYLTSARTWLHFPGLFAHAWSAVPGVFPRNTFKNQLNGSLWSLRYEIACYVMTGIVGMLGRRIWRPAVIAIAAGSVAGNALLHASGVAAPTWASWGAKLLACYATGMALYEFRDHVPYRGALAAAAAVALLVAARAGGLVWIFPVAGAYLLLYLACASWLPLARFGRFGDFSYGLYLYAYPVQQVILHVFGPKLPERPFFVAAFLVTLPFAIASWHLVEAPMLDRSRRHVTTRGIVAPRPEV